MTVTVDEGRFRLRWWCATGAPIPRTTAPAGWEQLLDELVEQGLADEGPDGVLVPRPHRNAARYTDEAAAAIAAAMCLMLHTLEAEGEVDSRTWFRRGAAVGISRDHVQLGYEWLASDALVVTEHRRTRPAQPLFWAKPKPAPEPVPQPAPQPALPTAPAAKPPAPQPAAKPVPQAEPKPEPKPAAPPPPAPQPAPEPELELSRPPARAERPKPKPKPAVPTSLTTELLARIAVAAETQAQLTIAGASRVRTPLGVSPLLDCQRRIAVVLAAADGPLTAGQVGTGHLTREQRRYRDAALADGVALGVFAAAGGTLGRGVRYTLRDPEPLGCTWDEVHAAAAAVRLRREAG